MRVGIGLIFRGALIGALVGVLFGVGATVLDAWIATRALPDIQDRFSLAFRLVPAGLQVGLLGIIGEYVLVGLSVGIVVILLLRLCRPSGAGMAVSRADSGGGITLRGGRDGHSRLSLVGLLVFFFVVGVSMTAGFWLRGAIDSWSADHVAEQHAARQRAARDILVKLQREYVDGELDLRGSVVSDEDMACLAYLPGLRSVLLSHTAITDRGVVPLIAVGSLDTLSLSHTAVSDDALQSIGEMTALRELYLSSTQVRGPGLRHLASLTQLRLLVLRHNAVDSQSLQHLPPLPALERLDLADTAVDNGGLRELARQPALQSVGLDKTRVTDSGFLTFSQQRPSLVRTVSSTYRDE